MTARPAPRSRRSAPRTGVLRRVRVGRHRPDGAVWLDGPHADEVVCVHPGWPPLRGRATVLRSWSMIMANTPYIQFVLTDVDVNVAGDVAVVTCAENILTGMPRCRSRSRPGRPGSPAAGWWRPTSSSHADGLAAVGAPRVAGDGPRSAARRTTSDRPHRAAWPARLGHHGVYDEERAAGQAFVVDVVLELDPAPAAASDDVAETVHYGELAAEVVEAVEGEPVDADRDARAARRRPVPGRTQRCRRSR